ncbi:MAG: hypothetical protein KDA44_06105 [Planctomycetales bacterium]|nr:hypothetical protein [Planctomycetales bacterium]
MNRHRLVGAVCAALSVIALMTPTACRAQEGKDIVWFGNSFTLATCCGSTRSVPAVLRDIAVAAGEPSPNIADNSVNGRSLQDHLNGNLRIIDAGIAPGDDWEFVVLQDYSTQPTHIGNLSLHLSSTLQLYQQVAARSANVVPVLYETWARGYGNAFYAGALPDFPGGPAEMQAELREGYEMSTANIDAVVGGDIARLAPAGDAWELADFPANFYGDGSYHASNRGTLLNALVIYGTIYGDPTTSDIDISGVLASLGLSAADGQQLTGLADSVLAVPEPGAWSLAAAACATIAWRRRRR